MGVKGKEPAMISRLPALAALAFACLAGCSTQMTDVARQSTAPGLTPAADLAASGPATVIPVSASNIHLVAARPGDVYLVGQGDVLQIHAIDAPELTLPTGYLVESDGSIDVPFLGRVPAADRDTATIRADIAQRLRAYLPQPQVQLRVIEYNSSFINVVGDVARPNRQALTAQPLTVIDAINAAGGFAQGADMRRVVILRQGQEIGVDMAGFLTSGAALPRLRKGDVVQVGRAAPRTPATAPMAATLHLPGQPVRDIALGAQPVSVAHLVTSAGGSAAQLRRGATVYHFEPAEARDPTIGGRMLLEAGDALILAPLPAISF